MSFKNEKTVNSTHHENLSRAVERQESEDAYKTVIGRELLHVIEESVIRMPLDYRTVFSLRVLNGMSTIETAEILNISEANVKIRLRRARQFLKQKIGEVYEPKDIFEFNLVYCDGVAGKVMKRVMSL